MGGNTRPATAFETTLRPGQVIGGNYRINYLLGEGGMATVWAGTNERTGKRIALKFIRHNLVDIPGAEAFLHSEGVNASRINHPNVVTAFDVIEHEGLACIVMELLDGEPFGSYLARNGALNLREVVGLLLPAMRGVAAAHAQGVIHRDLKPQNIFICVGPDQRVVTSKVLDFGISVMMDWAREQSAEPLQGVVGTPAYMSPEHIEGTAAIDERADVYGFGVLLYEALAGRPPFSGKSGAELLRKVLTEPAPSLAELRPDLPPSVVRIIETAMAKRPEDRYANLNAMVSALEDETMPPTPPPPTPAGGVPVATPAGGVPMSARIGLPVTTPNWFFPASFEYSSVIHAITCGFV